MKKFSLIIALLFAVQSLTVQAQAPTPTPLPWSISGYVYNDLNLNGQRDDGEPGLSSIPIQLNGPTTLTSATGSDGYYIFMNLTQGVYTVTPDFSALGFTASSPSPLVVTIGGPGVNLLFGGRPAPPTATPTATATATPIPTDTPLPTNTPTPAPTSTPAPTATPVPAADTPTPAPAANSCTLNADPYRDALGAAFNFVGAGFAPGSSVALGLALPDGSVEGLPAQQSNSAGSIGFSYSTQPGDQVGLYTMIAEGGDEGAVNCRVSTAFYVDDAPTPTPVKVVVQPAPANPLPTATTGPAEDAATPPPPPPPNPPPTNTKHPPTQGQDQAPLDDSVLVVSRPQATPEAEADDSPAALPGIGGIGGLRVTVYPNQSQTVPNLPANKEVSMWKLLLAGLGLVLSPGMVWAARKRFSLNRLGLGLVIALLAAATATIVLAQDGLGVPGKGQSRIEGHITNADDNTPPPDGTAIKIMVNGWLPVYSGADGEWNITQLGAGDYTVELVDLPAGFNPKQRAQTVTVNGFESDVVTLDLAYWSGPAPTEPLTATVTLTSSSRVAALGAAPPTAVPPTTTAEATRTTTQTITGQLPGISGAGALPALQDTDTPIIQWIVGLLTVGGLTLYAWLTERKRRMS